MAIHRLCLCVAVLGLQLSSMKAFTPPPSAIQVSMFSVSPQQQQQQQQQPSYSCAEKNTHHLSSTALFGFTRKNNVDKPKKSSKKAPQRKPESIKKLNMENDLMTNHKTRLATAGKAGTRRYADPTLVFIANLNFTATEEQLKEFLLPIVPSPWDIAKVQIVRDWKTGDSKGYAFVRFTEPVFATLCLQEMHQKEFLGRVLQVKPASSKSESPLRKQQREEQMKLKALRRAENPPPPPPPPKRESPEFLAYLDKDLVTEEDWIVAALEAETDLDTGDDDDDDDDDEIDGWEVPDSPAPKGFG